MIMRYYIVEWECNTSYHASEDDIVKHVVLIIIKNNISEFVSK